MPFLGDAKNFCCSEAGIYRPRRGLTEVFGVFFFGNLPSGRFGLKNTKFRHSMETQTVWLKSNA
jgi:hypothetical protein